MATKPQIAIIGAGLAGLTLAQRLAPVADLDIFEKSQGLGGRMSTRRATDHQFDHGAQYFTVQTASFLRFLAPFIASGQVAQWQPRIVALRDGKQSPVVWNAPRYVAVPGMTALCKAMSTGLDVHRGQRVAGLRRMAENWTVMLEDGTEKPGYDWVLSTAPAEQSALLLEDLADWTTIRMQGCYSLMLGFETDVGLPFDAAVVQNSPLAWIANNRSKPGREAKPSIMCQSDNAWAEDWMEADQSEVRQKLCDAFAELTRVDPGEASYVGLHRWRFAKVRSPATEPFLFDPVTCVGAAGDWCGQGRVETAFSSAEALAEVVLQAINRRAA